MTRIFLTFFLTLFSFQIWAQSPYELTWKRESIFIGIGTGLKIVDQIQQNNTDPLSLEEVLGLDRNSINSFDRSATFNNSGLAKTGSDILLWSSRGVPLLFLAGKTTRKEWGKIVLMFGEMYLLNSAITGNVKSLNGRIRPLAYNEDFSLDDRQKESNRFSFFSGHVSTTASNTFFAAKVFSDYYPDSKWKPYVWTAAILIPAATGLFRVEAGRHFPTDVMTGFLVGGAIGWLVPHLHRSGKKGDWSISPMGNGVYFSLNF